MILCLYGCIQNVLFSREHHPKVQNLLSSQILTKLSTEDSTSPAVCVGGGGGERIPHILSC